LRAEWGTFSNSLWERLGEGGFAQCGDDIAALQYQIMAVQQEQKMFKAGKVHACRDPKRRARR
jgi:hypothetical protein